MYLPPITAYSRPSTVPECVEQLNGLDQAAVIAGGQSLLPLLKSRQRKVKAIIDLSGVTELRHLEANSSLQVGSMVCYRDIAESPDIKRGWPALHDAANVIGDLQVRNRGTIGGNLSHAAVASDLPPVSICLEAELSLASAGGQRTVRAADFFVGPGETVLRQGELLTGIRFPAPPAREGSAYVKYGITTDGPPVIGVAALIGLDADGICTFARVVVGGVMPHATLARHSMDYLVGKRPTEAVTSAAAELAAKEIATHDDFRASARYRRQLISVYGAKALKLAAARAKEGV